MHEMTLALEICRIAETHVGHAALARVTEVGVEVATDGAVEPDSLEFCLQALLARHPFGRGRPVLHRKARGELRVTYLEVDDDGPAD